MSWLTIRGYGTSSGTSTENHAYQDIDTAYNYLTQDLKILPQHIIVFGRSVGGGSAVDLAVRKPVAGLIRACRINKKPR